jgi:uncharacterized protein (TIGR00645 family)
MEKPAVERWFERALFASRWMLAPFYVGLVCALGGLLIVFGRELYGELSHIMTLRPQDGVLMALSLIDLSLAGNLIVIVTLAGYENFVAKITSIDPAMRPDWMGTVDFSGLKIKVIASIVAISAVALLRVFLELAEPENTLDRSKVIWLIAILLTFVASGVLLAAMDLLVSRAESHPAIEVRKGPIPPS